MLNSRCKCSVYLLYATLAFAWNASLRAESEAQEFDIQAGDAIENLKVAAYQADVELLFALGIPTDLQTNSIKGLFTINEALNRMLEETPFMAVPVSGGEAFGIMKRAEKGANDPDRSENQQEDEITKRTQMNLDKNEKKRTIGGFFKGLIALALASVSQELPAQNDSETVYALDPFVVDSRDETVMVSQSISATRIATDLIELPFAVNVLPEQLLDDLNPTDMREAIQFAGNVVTGQPGSFGTSTYGGARLRGFPTTQNLINGFSVSTNFPVAPSSISRVEVVKGPASLLYGSIPPGGIINFISKRPRAKTGGSASMTFGTWDYRRLDLESTGPINDDVRYMIILSQEDRGFFWHGQEREQININPQIEFDFAEDRGNVLIDYYHNRTDQRAVTSAPGNLRNAAKDPYGRQLLVLGTEFPFLNFNTRDRGAPHLDETDSLNVVFRYRLNDQYTLRANWRNLNRESERINQAVGLPGWEGGGSRWDDQNQPGDSSNIQVNLLAEYNFEWAKFQIMPGYDRNEASDWFFRVRAGSVDEDGIRNGNFTSDPKDISDPSTWLFNSPAAWQYFVDDPSTPEYEGPGLLRNNSGNEGSSTDYYVYGAGYFLKDRLLATAGWRRSSFSNASLTTNEVVFPDLEDINPGTEISDSDSIYQLGTLYKLIPEKLHVYANKAQSFQPQLRTIQLPDADGNPLDADIDGDGTNDAPLLNDNVAVPADHLFGEGWELGVKGSLLDGKLGYSLAVFETTNNNIIRAVAVNSDPGSYEAWYPNLDDETKALLAALPQDTRIDQFQIQSGEELSQGWEFEATARLAENWDLRMTYTNLDTYLVADASFPVAEGRRLGNSPEHNFNLYTRYRLNDGFYFGGSADWMSIRYSGNPQNGHGGTRAASTLLLNMFAGYRVQIDDLTYRLQLNIQNVTDEWASDGNPTSIVTPRMVRLTAGVEF